MLREFLQNLTAEDAQWITYAGLAILAYTIVSGTFVIFTERSRATTRFLTISSLTAALLMGFMGGILYLWHHYYRV